MSVNVLVRGSLLIYKQKTTPPPKKNTWYSTTDDLSYYFFLISTNMVNTFSSIFISMYTVYSSNAVVILLSISYVETGPTGSTEWVFNPSIRQQRLMNLIISVSFSCTAMTHISLFLLYLCCENNTRFSKLWLERRRTQMQKNCFVKKRHDNATLKRKKKHQKISRFWPEWHRVEIDD